MSESTKPTDQPTTNTAGAPLSVVGLGASAGGLAALNAFFDAIPDDTGMTFVVVTHLSPDHESIMAELLQAHTAMPVSQVGGLVKMEPNQVYVIPPGKRLVVTEGHLDLADFAMPRGRRLQIDTFFRTLAEEHGDGAAIILSGTGSDGAVGIQQVKEGGGLILAQDPAEAEFNAMPQSAIATGLVDIIAPVAELAAQLVAAKQTRAQLDLPADPEELSPAAQETFAQILDYLDQQTGHDFAGYRRGPLLQRIGRRMQLAGVQTLSGYLQRLRGDAAEVDALYHDLVIHLTEFFRDGPAWTALADQVIPGLFAGKGRGDTVRVWTVGCAHGEEAYSIAILLLEHAATLRHPPQIQVFASDLGKPALDFARQGVYPEAIAANLSEERLTRFFAHENNHYRVRQPLRDRVLFAGHNLLQDPAFNRLDLIICRNVLVYLQRAVQEQLYAAFHYALEQAGGGESYLFLGATDVAAAPAETLRHGDRVLFEPLVGSHQLYRRRAVAAHPPRYPLQTAAQRAAGAAPPATVTKPAVDAGQPVEHEEMHRLLLEEMGPPSLLVDEQYQVLHLSESAGRFLHLPGGALTRDVTRLVHLELQQELRRALAQAFTTGRNVYTKPVLVHFESALQPVALLIQPSRQQGRALILIFAGESVDLAHLPINPLADEDTDSDTETALAVSHFRQRLTALDFSHAAMVEELRSTNAELQSANEEYRALLSELEVNKEELRSTNEELRTVNEELVLKAQQSSETYSDLQNFLAATEIGALYLDRELRVVRYTTHAADLFNLIPSDRGRPIRDLHINLRYDDLARDARRVLDSLTPITRDIECDDGRWYLVSLRPYRTIQERIDGVIITLVDITANKQIELALRDAKEYADSIVQTIPDALLVLNPDLRVQRVNEAFYTIFQVDAAETKGQLVYELGNHQWNIPELRTLLEEILPDNQLFTGYEVTHTFETIGRRTMLLNGRRLEHSQLILLTITDITARKQAEEALQASEARQTFLLQLSDALRPLTAPVAVQAAACRLLGEQLGVDRAYYVEIDEGKGEACVQQNYLRGDSPSLVGAFPLAEVGWTVPYLRRGEAVIVADTQTAAIVPDADRGWMADLQMHAHISMPIVKRGALMGALCVTEPTPRVWRAMDVELTRETAERIWEAVERARVENALSASEERYRTLFTTIDQAFALCEIVLDAEGQPVDYRMVEVNPAFEAMTGFTLAQATGATARELVPGLEDWWIETYGKVALTGEPVRFENYVAELDRWYDAYAFSSAHGTFALLFKDISERRKSEAALAASEERYRLLVESAQEYAIFMLDPTGHITSWNTGAERIFGYREAEALGQLGAVIFTEEDRAAGVPEVEMATAVREGQASDDRWHRRRDGSRFWANGVMEALRQPDGTLSGFAKVLRDNTAPKRAADALRESEWRYQQALQAAQLGTWRYDPATDTNYFDERSQAIFGFAQPTCTAAEVDRFIHPDDFADFDQARDAALDPTGMGTFNYTHRIIQPSGAVRWVRANCQVFFAGVGADRRPVEAIGLISDVTERREAAHVLRVSEERYRTLFESIDEGFCIIEVIFDDQEQAVDYRFLTVNPAFERYTGLYNAVGKRMRELEPRHEEQWFAIYGQIARTGEPQRFINEARFLSERWYDVYAFRVGEPAEHRVAILFHDISARVRAEQALRQLNETLEGQVEQRTRQVRELVSQLSLSEQEERQRISAILHDDLQQRLYSLQYQLAFLQGDLDAASAEEQAALGRFQSMNDELKAAVALTLSLSVDLSPPVLEGEGLAAALGWLATQMQQRHGLTIHIVAAEDVPTPPTDLRVLLFQVVRELLFNIVKHADVKETTVTIGTIDGQFQIEVTDQGRGFNVAAVLHDPARSHGLLRNQQRLELIGGQMTIESSAGHGTRVTLTCPLPGR
jgi:two-component system CheB/CheR fusion protein